jgi:hypothetical protein
MSLFIIFMLSFANSPQSGVFDLESYTWKNRIVLLFSDSDSNTDLEVQVRELLSDKEGLEERYLKIFKISHGESAIDLLSQDTLRMKHNLRAKYKVSDAGFYVVLIGKDGSVKYNDSSPVSGEKLFAIIDAMPMRKSEMRNR